MRIHSSSFDSNGTIPSEFALGAPGGFGGNRNPQLAWEDAPTGTRSFALLCIDADAHTDPSLAGRDDLEIPVAHPRGEFIHWALRSEEHTSELKSLMRISYTVFC